LKETSPGEWSRDSHLSKPTTGEASAVREIGSSVLTGVFTPGPNVGRNIRDQITRAAKSDSLDLNPDSNKYSLTR